MIISSLMNVIYSFFEFILSPINIDSFPEGTAESIIEFLDMLFMTGQSIIGLLIPEFCQALLIIVITIEIGLHIFNFVMWILRKIPMLGIN